MKIDHTVMFDDTSKFNDSDKAEDGVLHAAAGAPYPPAGSARRYRSTLFNVILIGLISLTQPGIWSALNS